MLASPRSALLVLAALSASSVAPAQVGAASEPLMPIASLSMPKVVVPELITDQVTAPDSATAPLTDELAPLPETKVETPARPSGDLASLVAQFRGSNPGSRELECLAVGIYFESKS